MLRDILNIECFTLKGIGQLLSLIRSWDVGDTVNFANWPTLMVINHTTDHEEARP